MGALHINGQNQLLKNKGSNHKDSIGGRKSIQYRGHCEVNTIYDSDKLSGVLNLNERATRNYILFRFHLKPSTINKHLSDLINKIRAHDFLSITSDNGTELAYLVVLSTRIIYFDFLRNIIDLDNETK